MCLRTDYPFQSTSPVWRTTFLIRSPVKPKRISIHVPRVEDDRVPACTTNSPRYFNPRPPCGGRLAISESIEYFALFQSTSPVWRTTTMTVNTAGMIMISIHVPRVEDDNYFFVYVLTVQYFNPRPPCGGRLTRAVDNYAGIEFQSTSPVWRTTAFQFRF